MWTIHAQEPPPPPKRSKAPVVIGAGLAAALVVAGGGFAFVQADPFNLFGAGAQPAEALPADAVAYAGIDLDPSAGQKIDAIRFLNHFPAFRDKVDIRDERDDVREEIINSGLEELDCKGVSYDDTFKPWLGYKFGAGLLPGDGEPAPVFAVEVTDADKAASGLDALNECDPGGEAAGYAFVGDYLLIAETQAIADGAAADAEQAALSDDDDFKADMESLGDQGIATGWMDVAGFAQAMPEAGFGNEDEIDAVVASAQRMAATFRFDNDHVELVSTVHSDAASIDHGDNEIVDLPDSTAVALSVAGGSDRIEASWSDVVEQAEKNGVDIDQMLNEFEQQTGFSVPGDLQTLFGDNLLVAVGSRNLDSRDFSTIEDMRSRVDAGARFTGDAAEIQDLYDRIVSLARDGFGIDLPLDSTETDDGLVLATNEDYATELGDMDGDLGDSETFRSVVDDAASKELVLFVDLNAFDVVFGDSVAASPDAQESIENYEPLRAFGITAEIDDDYATTTMRLSVDD